MSALSKAIDVCGSQTELARRIGDPVRTGHIYYWLRARIPAEYCEAIEKATAGAVTRHDLRPDVFGTAPGADLQEAG